MRLKTLGVILVTAMAAFTMFFWVTDDARRAAIGAEHDEELVHFGEIVFSDDPSEPAAAGCARCHGADGTGGDADAIVIGPNLHSRSIADKLQANSNYVRLAVSYGGVVVSGNVKSLMPAWSSEVGGQLNKQQIEAVVTLVEGWAAEAAEQPIEDVPDTVEAGAEVYASAGCASCHGADLAGGIGPNLQTIGSALVTDLEIAPTGLDQMVADYEADAGNFLELWIRDSAGTYNDGASTGMPAHPEGQLSESALTALITFLLDQTAE